MTYRFFDAHSHLNLADFDTDRADVIRRMAEEETGTITVGVDLETSRKAVFLAEEHPHLFAAVGMHPVDDPAGPFDAAAFRALALSPQTVAIGECGLDYFRLGPDSREEKRRQREIFAAQIALARNVGKPLMLHCRPSKGSMDAYEDALDMLEDARKEHPALSGNAHFFVGDMAVAKRFLDLGFTMSFPGVITFARDYDEVLRSLPLTSILSETDAPFAAPEPYRGRRNSPLYVKEVVRAIADIRGEAHEPVRVALGENARRAFSL